MEKRDELWQGGPCFYYDTALFPPGTDSFLLAYFARPARGETVCDLGSGTGLLGTLLLAREEVSCTLADVCAAAARVLRWGGRFALVHRAERLTDVLCTLRVSGIEPKRLRFFAASATAAPSLVLVEGRRGGKSGLTVEPPLLPRGEEWDKVYFRAR